MRMFSLFKISHFTVLKAKATLFEKIHNSLIVPHWGLSVCKLTNFYVYEVIIWIMCTHCNALTKLRVLLPETA